MITTNMCGLTLRRLTARLLLAAVVATTAAALATEPAQASAATACYLIKRELLALLSRPVVAARRWAATLIDAAGQLTILETNVNELILRGLVAFGGYKQVPASVSLQSLVPLHNATHPAEIAQLKTYTANIADTIASGNLPPTLDQTALASLVGAKAITVVRDFDGNYVVVDGNQAIQALQSALGNRDIPVAVSVVQAPLRTVAYIARRVRNARGLTNATDQQLIDAISFSAIPESVMQGDIADARNQVAELRAMIAAQPALSTADAAELNMKLSVAINTQRMIENALLWRDRGLKDVEAAGLSFEQIRAMFTQQRPLGFTTNEQFQQFLTELNHALAQDGLDDYKYWVDGTATTFYSQNPSKPAGTYFDSKTKSDCDMKIYSPKALTRLNARGLKWDKAPGVFMAHWMMETFPALGAFSSRWTTLLGRPITMIGISGFKPAYSDGGFQAYGPAAALPADE